MFPFFFPYYSHVFVATTYQLLAQFIYKRTKGVPRFLGYTFEYLKTKLQHWTKGDIKKELLGAEYLKFLDVPTRAESELRPYRQLLDKEFYIELVRIAALQIPVDMDLDIKNASVTYFGLDKNWGPDAQCEAPLIELAYLYNLYIERVYPGSKEWKIVVPDVVLDVMDLSEPRLPFWISYCKSPASNAFKSGPFLEGVVLHCLALRVGEEIAMGRETKKVKEIFPFLQNSVCADEEIVREKKYLWSPLPKLVYSKPGPSSKMSSAELKAFSNRLQKFFEAVKNGDDISTTIQVNVLDWSLIHPYLQPGRLYIPGGANGMSASEDLRYCMKNSDLAFQMKEGEQVADLNTVSDEGIKSSLGKHPHKNLTLVIVATNVDTNLENVKGTKIIMANNQKMAVYFPPETILQLSQKFFGKEANVWMGLNLLNKHATTWTIPKGMDIVVLLSEGLEFLLTPQNVELFKDRAKEGVLQSQLKASMKRKHSFPLQPQKTKHSKLDLQNTTTSVASMEI